MRQLGFYFDQTTCIGCNACQVACKDYHHLELGNYYRRVDTIAQTIDGRTEFVHYSGACNHCQDAACVKACSGKALKHHHDGTVIHEPASCIGCGTCTWVCPYGAISLSTVSGKANKCDSCQALRVTGQKPACVEACLTGCLQFGVLEEFEITSSVNCPPFLPDSSLTSPALVIKCKKRGACDV